MNYAPSMITTIAIIERLKEIKNWSYYRIAQELEVSQSAIYNWRRKGTIMEDKTAMKAAELLSMPPEFIVANIHAERAVNSPEIELLMRIADMVEKETQAPDFDSKETK